MAKVYKAEDRLLERTVAVKVLRSQYVSDQAFVERFRQEAKSAAGLAHPNIVSVYDVGVDGDWNYIIMEYVEGPSLKELIVQGAPFANARAVDIGLQILSALSYAHQKGLVHRDIKPQNILISADGTAKVTDFGIARAVTGAQLTETGVVLGTVHYFSPEQAKGEMATPASDLYSVGIVLYEMLTGQLPFQGDNTLGIALKQVQEQPVPPSRINPRITPSIEGIITRAMSKEPSGRYPNAAAMKQALANYRQLGEQMTAPVTAMRGQADTRAKSATVVPPGIKGIERRRRGVDWFAIVLTVLILGFVAASVPVAAKVYDLYLAPSAPQVATSVTPTPSPTRIPPSPTPTSVPRAKVPQLVGLPYAEARKQLEERKLQIRVMEEQYNDRYEPNTIIAQSVKSETEVQTGYVVDVIVSKGPERVTVPGVVGEVLNAAIAKLTAADLKSDVSEDWFDNVAAGKVVQQKPAGGERVARGSIVAIVVSKGKRPASEKRATVPSLIGLPEAEAQLRIAMAGLMPTYVNYQGPGDIPDSELRKVQPGYVLSQRPAPGSVVDLGTMVYIAVRKK